MAASFISRQSSQCLRARSTGEEVRDADCFVAALPRGRRAAASVVSRLIQITEGKHFRLFGTRDQLQPLDEALRQEPLALRKDQVSPIARLLQP